MKSRTVGRLVRLAVAIFFVAAIVTPASAGPAVPSKVTNFFTNALDACGCFKLVECSKAHQVSKNDIVRETYHCKFVSDEFWGEPALPESAMVWDYENTKDLEPCEECSVPVAPPYRWFSDVEDIQTGDECWMYTNPQGEDIGNSSFRMVITPSGNVNITVVYDPPVFEGPDCPSSTPSPSPSPS